MAPQPELVALLLTDSQRVGVSFIVATPNKPKRQHVLVVEESADIPAGQRIRSPFSMRQSNKHPSLNASDCGLPEPAPALTARAYQSVI